MTIKKYNEAGVCPICGKIDLEYGSTNIDGDQLAYEWTCLDCKATGKEWYSLQFVEHILSGE